MSSPRFLICILALSVVGATGQIGEGKQSAPEMGEFSAQYARALEGAGSDLTEASLTVALFDTDLLIASAASMFLVRVAESSLSVHALLSLLRSGPDEMASSAARALYELSRRDWEHRMLAREWEAAAAARLDAMGDPLSPVYVGLVLARAGRSDGWPYVKGALLRGFGATSAENILLFHGLADQAGRTVDVVAELKEALDSAPPGAGRDALGSALDGVHEELRRRGTRPDPRSVQ